jgi:tetratricopeptide (TPR) repeat protein
MNLALRCLLLLGVIVPIWSSMAAVNTSTTVALLDFAIVGQDTNAWGWAKGGIADLLQVELDQRGLVTLDRGFIQAVLSERKMAVGGMADTDCKSVATILGAKFLVTGKVIPLEGGKCRIEASAFSVETIETVATGVGEGTLPKELPVVLQKVADGITAGLSKDRHAGTVARQTGVRSPDPEALIAYYKGLDAYSEGYPEIAAAWFLDSVGLDANFAPAQLWEIKAYRTAGLESHARIREKEIAGLLKRLGIEAAHTNGTSGPDARGVALLKPSLVLLAGHAPVVDVALLTAALKQGALGAKSVRLFDPVNIVDSLVEQDRTLSGLFSPQGGVRYGQWSMVDALLLCRVEEQPDGKLLLSLSLCDPMSSVVQAEEWGTAAVSEIEKTVQTYSDRLLKTWMGSRSCVNSTGSQGGTLPRAADRLPVSKKQFGGVGPFYRTTVALFPEERERIADLPSLYQDIAADFIGRRDNPDCLEGTSWGDWGTLIYDFTKLGRHRQAEEEMLRIIESINLETQDAPRKLYRIANQYAGFLLYKDNQLPWMQTWEYRDRPMKLLFTRFPNTIWAGGKRFWLASRYWESGKYLEAGENAHEARLILAKMVSLLENGPDTNVVQDIRRAIVTAYYIEADALSVFRHTNEVMQIVSEVEAFVQKHNVPKNFPKVFYGLESWPLVYSGNWRTYDICPGAKWKHGRHPGYYADMTRVPVKGTNTAVQASLKAAAPLPAFGEDILLLLKQKLSSSECKTRMDRMTARLSANQSLPFAVWMKYANCLSAEERHEEAMRAYQQAFSQGAPQKYFAGLLVAMVTLAVDHHADHVDDEMKRLFQELGVEPIEIAPEVWFNVGRKLQDAGQVAKAVICYRRVLDFERPELVPTSFFFSEQFPWGSDFFQKDRAEKFSMGFSSDWRAIVLSSKYFLAEGLITSGAFDEAAEILRTMVRDFGDEEVVVLVYSGHMYWDWSKGFRIKIGSEAARLLEKLHAREKLSPGGAGTNTTDKVPRRIESFAI